MEQDPVATMKALDDLFTLLQGTRKILITFANREGLYDELVMTEAEIAQGLGQLMKEIIDLKWRVLKDTDVFGNLPVFPKRDIRIVLGHETEEIDEDWNEYEDN